MGESIYTDKNNKVKLDIGCGRTWKNLRDKFGMIGIDIYDFGQAHVLDVRKGIPWEDNSVDIIRASHFLEHLTPEEAVSVLNEMWRVLKPEGTLHAIVPSALHSKSYVLPHRSFWTEDTFRDLAREDRGNVYGIKQWVSKGIVTNKRFDVHANLSPLK